MRGFLISLLAALLLATIAVPASAETGYRLIVFGKEVPTVAAPFEEDGRLWLPLRDLSEALGYSVEYEPETQMITLTRPLAARRYLYLQVGSDQVRDADRSYSMGAPVLLRDGRAFVPQAFVLDILGLATEWDLTGKVILVNWPTEGLPEKVQHATIRLCTLRVMKCDYDHLME